MAFTFYLFCAVNYARMVCVQDEELLPFATLKERYQECRMEVFAYELDERAGQMKAGKGKGKGKGKAGVDSGGRPEGTQGAAGFESAFATSPAACRQSGRKLPVDSFFNRSRYADSERRASVFPN